MVSAAVLVNSLVCSVFEISSAVVEGKTCVLSVVFGASCMMVVAFKFVVVLAFNLKLGAYVQAFSVGVG